MDYYNTNIQLHIDVIKDILGYANSKPKTLVFGLGYDSKMWYSANPNTFFIEDNEKYIQLNRDIDPSHIIKYSYPTTVKTSFTLTDLQLQKLHPPLNLLRLAPFDIIIIDGPAGYSSRVPGRLLPCFWTHTYLSKVGTLVYIDDCRRKLEAYCINKFFKSYPTTLFKQRNGCKKIIIPPLQTKFYSSRPRKKPKKYGILKISSMKII